MLYVSVTSGKTQATNSGVFREIILITITSYWQVTMLSSTDRKSFITLNNLIKCYKNLKRLHNLFKITQMVRGRIKIKIHIHLTLQPDHLIAIYSPNKKFTEEHCVPDMLGAKSTGIQSRCETFQIICEGSVSF